MRALIVSTRDVLKRCNKNEMLFGGGKRNINFKDFERNAEGGSNAA